MPTEVKVKGKKFKLSASGCKIVDRFPNDTMGRTGLRCNHMVSLSHGGRTTKFRFTNSIAEFERGKRTLDKSDLKNAFESFISDAIYGTYDYGTFVSELGYDEWDSRTKRIWRETQKAAEKAKRLGLSEDEFYEIANALQGD
jgi:hypothetical protein